MVQCRNLFVDSNDLILLQVDVNIDDDLNQILIGSDPLVRLGLDPKDHY